MSLQDFWKACKGLLQICGFGDILEASRRQSPLKATTDKDERPSTAENYNLC